MTEISPPHQQGSRHFVLSILALVTGAALTAFLAGKLIFAWFSMMDDHHIIEWLNFKDHLSISDTWSALMSTELGQNGPRFRPVYYLLLVGEAVLWGNKPFGYQVVRVLEFWLFLSACAYVAFRGLGYVIGLAILFSIVNLAFWGDILTYSFLSEQPAVLGMAFVIFGFGGLAKWYVEGGEREIGWALILSGLGCLICTGSKENFIFLIAPQAAAILLAVYKKKVRAAPLAVSLVLLGLTCAIALVIIKLNWGRPTDFYGDDNSIAHRLGLVTSYQWLGALIGILSAGVVLFASAFLLRIGRYQVRKLQAMGTLLIICSVYVFWEIFFYNGRIPSGVRYDLPSTLIFPLAGAVLAYLVMEVSGFVSSRWIFRVALAVVISAVIATSSLAVRGLQWPPVINAVQKRIIRSTMMRDDIEASKRIASEHPQWPIILAPTHPFDYEPVVTLPIWFENAGIRNPRGILYAIPPGVVDSHLFKILAEAINSWGTQGIPDKFEPVAKFKDAMARGECYEVAFPKSLTTCILLPYKPQSYLAIQ